jgi:hypothetical protein
MRGHVERPTHRLEGDTVGVIESPWRIDAVGGVHPLIITRQITSGEALKRRNALGGSVRNFAAHQAHLGIASGQLATLV